jgi:hypothetical protein
MLAVIGGWCQHRTTMRETMPEMVFGLQRLAGHRLRRGKMSERIYKYFSTILHGEHKVRVAGMDVWEGSVWMSIYYWIAVMAMMST